MTAPPALSVERAVELLRLYATRNDCPVCFAEPKMVDQTVLKYPNMTTYVGGHLHVEHGLSCDVGRALDRVTIAGDDT